MPRYVFRVYKSPLSINPQPLARGVLHADDYEHAFNRLTYEPGIERHPVGLYENLWTYNGSAAAVVLTTEDFNGTEETDRIEAEQSRTAEWVNHGAH